MDLKQVLELDMNDNNKVLELMKVCSEMIIDRELRKKTVRFIDQARWSLKQPVPLNTLYLDEHQISFSELAQHIAKLADQRSNVTARQNLPKIQDQGQQGNIPSMEQELPRTIVCIQHHPIEPR